jgi:MFS family permease
MSFFHYKENNVTRNYEVVASGFSLAPNAELKSESKTFRWNKTLITDIAALFSSITLSAIGYGISTALIALTVNKYIKNELLISLSSASQLAAGVVFARFLPGLGRKLGMINTLYFASSISALCSLILFFYIGYFPWVATVFIFGVSLFVVGVTRQTIMIDIAPPHFKAMIISLGGMLVAIGNSFGPVLLGLLKTSTTITSYLIACIFYLLSMLPLARLRKAETEVKEEKRIGIWRYIQASPKIMFAGFCVNYSLASANTFLIIYGMKIGMSETNASLLYSVLLFGTIFSIPLGYLTDLVNRRFLMIFSAVLSLICISLLYVNQNPDKIYLLLFLTFGCMTGIKLPAVVLINEKYKPTQRLAVNAAFSKFSLMGNLFGIFCTGSIMRSYGPNGLWASLAIIISFYLIFCTMNYIKKAFKGELAFAKFSLTNKSQMEN